MKDLAKMVGEKLNINPEHIEFSISSRTEFEAVGMKERAIDVKRRVAYSTKLFATEMPGWVVEDRFKMDSVESVVVPVSFKKTS